MIRDVLDLVRKEARIDRVQHGPHSRHAEIELHVPMVVPRERRDAIPWVDPEHEQGFRRLLRAATDVGVRATMDRALDHPRDDFGAGMKRVRMLDQPRDQQRTVLHQSFQHGGLYPVGRTSFVQKYRLRSASTASKRWPYGGRKSAMPLTRAWCSTGFSLVKVRNPRSP